MNLQEDIQRIKSMMGVITEDETPLIRKMVDEIGLINTIKMIGNYYTIEPYLKDIDKVNFIKDKVAELCDEFDNTGFGLNQIDVEPIHFSDDDNELRQIEYLGKNRVIIDVYDEDMGYHLDDYDIQYENLPSQIIEELVEILLNK
jgi:hypothetical protein